MHWKIHQEGGGGRTDIRKGDISRSNKCSLTSLPCQKVKPWVCVRCPAIIWNPRMSDLYHEVSTHVRFLDSRQLVVTMSIIN